MRRLLFIAVVAFVALGVGRPGELSAQSDDLASSLTAYCIDHTCAQVWFTLDVDGPVYMSNMLLMSMDETLWKFGGLVQVLDAFMNDVTADWLPGTFVSDNELFLISGSPNFAADPLHFVIQMDPAGTQEQLTGNLMYTANGYQEIAANGVGSHRFSASGSAVVTPEPVTTVFLATGLLGLVFVARRRRSLLARAQGE